ncbi:MAG: hypothetical protein SNJ82_06115 [Gemmataceae bacterium]
MPTSNSWAGLLLGGLALWCSACSSYPPPSSAESLKLLAALRTACAGQNSAQLEAVEQKADQARAQGRLQPAEYEALRRIWQQAREGNWQQAEADCLAYQKAQRR